MKFSLTEEQQIFQESVDNFISKEYHLDMRRSLMSTEEGFSRENWKKFSELGWLGLTVDVNFGGAGGRVVDSATLMESLGKGLILEPVLSTAVMCANIIQLSGTNTQKQAILPKIANGDLLVAFGFAEPGSHYNLSHVKTKAIRKKSMFKLNGKKIVVLHASSADKIIVSARSAGDTIDFEGISLFILDKSTKGLTLNSYPTIDGQRASELVLRDVEVNETNMIGHEGNSYSTINDTIDRTIIAICAEAVGIMQVLINLTQDYINTRHQFGQQIKNFQVLQHKLVDMYMSYELSKALTYRAALIVDTAHSSVISLAASAAKAQIGKAGKLIGQEAIQLHGGMGMTDELAVGHYFKRLTMIDTQFGNMAYHKQRFGQLRKTI